MTTALTYAIFSCLTCLLLTACGGSSSDLAPPGEVWSIPAAGPYTHTSCSATFKNATAAPVQVNVSVDTVRSLITSSGNLGAQTFAAYRVDAQQSSSTAAVAVHDGAQPGKPLSWRDAATFSMLLPAGSTLTVDAVAAILGAAAGAELQTSDCAVTIKP
jgi:hypothetical protein